MTTITTATARNINNMPSMSCVMHNGDETVSFVDVGNDVLVRFARRIGSADYLTTPHANYVPRSTCFRMIRDLRETGWTDGAVEFFDAANATLNAITLRHLPGNDHAGLRAEIRRAMLRSGYEVAITMAGDNARLAGDLARYALANGINA